MNFSTLKKYKLIFIKVIIVSMTMLYVLKPMHSSINKLLHEIAHVFEMPDNIINHKTRAENLKIHKSKKHYKAEEKHNHNILNAVDKMLSEINNGNDSESAILKFNSLDKFIKTPEYFKKNQQFTTHFKAANYYDIIEIKLCKGYLNRFKEPPKV